MQRAIENLLGNAVRYGKFVRLSVDLQDARIEFTIEDDGPGIPTNQRETALEPFSRLDSARNQNDNVGSGLGLAIATDLARSHGGHLKLYKCADLGGLKAVISLPR
ncbi:MAG: hypothetical protein COB77_00205 [Gammaproteobacteria bacterium]|nr:MAG: hypothetical protein COB77_00205 [Gammaproteobacteria bacterium]